MLRSCAVLVGAAFLFSLAGGGCEPSGATLPSTPDGTVTAFAQGMAEGKPEFAWAALPEKYQKQVQEELVHAFAKQMDAEVYGKGAAVAKKLVNLLRDKKQFALEMVGATPILPMAGMDKAQLDKSWNTVVSLLDTVVTSELGDINKLKTVDVGAFLRGTGVSLMQKMSEISALSKQDPYNKEFKAMFAGLKAEVVTMEGDEATVKMTTPGQEPRERKMKRVDGKWLFKEMVDDWDKEIGQVKESIAGMGKSIAEQKPKILEGLAMAEKTLDDLATAKTQEEFMQKLMPLLGGLMGGGMPGMGGGE